ncbi:ImmA/IrrE family metallo-endopeptidase [Leuconostoc pseudomesenteroides]|uniref:ImmA/IrrE family metallo-endopeptidase n=1 Tax=Leuconostoc pseudomesenteroides TaxID=33968 RepID=UPI001668ABBF|nr:hypothetical protein [Leuconostoc pseudomesenteroides]
MTDLEHVLDLLPNYAFYFIDVSSPNFHGCIDYDSKAIYLNENDNDYVQLMTALHEYGHADDIPTDYSNKKRYKTLLAEKQANMTATRLMNDLFKSKTNLRENSI